MEHEVYFRCGDELFEALSLAAVAVCEESVNLYVRKFLESAHIEHINQVRAAHNMNKDGDAAAMAAASFFCVCEYLLDFEIKM